MESSPTSSPSCASGSRSCAAAGRSRARRKHLDRGKLLVRDRVDRLLDPGSPFLELSPLAAFGMYGKDGTR